MKSKRNILFLINPKSGIQSKADLPKLIENNIDKHKHDYKIEYTRYAGHACELAKDASEQGVDVVVAVGGDGTVNEVGRSLAGTKTAMGILPFGSGNGLARHLGVPMEVKKAIEFLNAAEPTCVDYGKINGKPFFCTCGVGFDALVSHTFSKGNRRGVLGYFNNMLTDWVNYKPEVYEIETEWSTTKMKAFLIACGNASQYGNNAYITPFASMRDGMLSVTMLTPFTSIDVPVILSRMLGRSLHGDSHMRTFNARWIKIKRRKPGVVHFDGEPYEMDADILVETIPSGLNVMTKPGWDGNCVCVPLYKQVVEMLSSSLDPAMLKGVLPFKEGISLKVPPFPWKGITKKK